MNQNLRTTIVIFVAILCFVDTFTTVIGLYAIVKPTKDNPLAFIFVFAPAIAILVLLLMTDIIWRSQSFIHTVLKCFWGIALLYDIYTSLAANLGIVLFNIEKLSENINVFDGLKNASGHQLVVVVVATVLISGSPILLPYLLHDKL
jgi:hypothetical protein